MTMNELSSINRSAHLHYLHPNRMPWNEAASDLELDFLSRSLIGRPNEEDKAVAYLYKELAQLAELEMHVSSVLVMVLSELQQQPEAPFNDGDTIYHALSCFAAEEINHANSFYQYVRHLSGRDIKLQNNLFNDRMAVFQEGDSPLVKLAALCATAYVGESIITVFERRFKELDPTKSYFLTRLLHFHGLDEARHIQSDHFVFDNIVPQLSSLERKRMHELIDATEELNTELAITSAKQIKSEFDIDYSENNRAAEIQLELTQAFREIVQSGDHIVKIDDALDPHVANLVARFSNTSIIHAPFHQ